MMDDDGDDDDDSNGYLHYTFRGLNVMFSCIQCDNILTNSCRLLLSLTSSNSHSVSLSRISLLLKKFLHKQMSRT